MAQRILFVSSASSFYTKPLEEAFGQLGYETYFVDYRGSRVLAIGSPIHRIINRMPDAVRNYLTHRANRGIDRAILERAREIRPNYIIASKAKYIDPTVLAELRRITPTLNWYPDSITNLGSLRRAAAHYDLVFNHDRLLVERLRQEGFNNIFHLPLAGHIHSGDMWTDNRLHEVALITPYDPRLFETDQDINILREIDIKIWGDKKWLQSPLRDRYQGTIKENDERTEIYRTSKMAIYIEPNRDTRASGVPLTPFEITANGALLLGQSARGEIFELFRDTAEFVSWSTVNELAQKIQYYQSHKSEQEKIAQAGFNRTRRDHNFLNRVQIILATVEKHYPIIQ